MLNELFTGDIPSLDIFVKRRNTYLLKSEETIHFQYPGTIYSFFVRWNQSANTVEVTKLYRPHYKNCQEIQEIAYLALPAEIAGRYFVFQISLNKNMGKIKFTFSKRSDATLPIPDIRHYTKRHSSIENLTFNNMQMA